MSFKEDRTNDAFVWHPLLVSYVSGVASTPIGKRAWIKDVDIVYLPMNWGSRHWVGLAMDLRKGHIDILDPFEDYTSARKVALFMSHIAQMLPKLIMSVYGNVAYPWPPSGFTFSRVSGLSQNKRGGDCGPLALKFIEFHMHGLEQHLQSMTASQVDNIRLRYAIDVYEAFVSKL